MIELVLDDAGMKAPGRAGDQVALVIDAAVPHMGWPFHETAQARHREASLPSAFARGLHDLKLRIDEDRQRCCAVEPLLFGEPGIVAALGRLEHHHAQRHMHLRGGKPGAVGIDHGLYHVGDQAADVRRGRVGDRLCLAGKDGVAHAGDFQDGHAGNMRPRARGATEG